MPAPEGDIRYMGVCGEAGVKGVKGVCGECGVLQRKEDMLSLMVQCPLQDKPTSSMAQLHWKAVEEQHALWSLCAHMQL